MTQTVRVQSCNPDGTAQVVHIRQSACSGDCHKCSGCGAAQETLVLTARNPIGAAPGDLVQIEAETAPVLTAAAILYMLPLVLFFIGYAAGSIWGKGALVACTAFGLGIGICVLYDRRMGKKQKTVYTITGFRRQPPQEP